MVKRAPGIYAIGLPNGLVKFGKSTNLQSRIQSHQALGAGAITFIEAEYCDPGPAEAALLAEARARFPLAGPRIKTGDAREIFHATEPDARELLTRAAAAYPAPTGPSPAELTAAELRAVMDRHGLTRGDVCRILGLKPRNASGSTGTVDDWLRGATPVPRAKLAHILQQAPSYTRADGLRRSALHATRSGVEYDVELEGLYKVYLNTENRIAQIRRTVAGGNGGMYLVPGSARWARVEAAFYRQLWG